MRLDSEEANDFLRQILDSVAEHIVVIDDAGVIQYANRRWSEFARENACVVDDAWVGVNYLEECDKAASMNDDFGVRAGEGIRRVIENKREMFYFEYPCHSPEVKRWFMMRATPFQSAGKNYFVISHQDITERKQAEEEIENLAKTDGLTNIPNRRTFNEFLHAEWKRCARLRLSISLALVDLDHFKILNDTHGHQAGDRSLVEVGRILEEFSRRPGDICARYGGEEFALVWGNTSLAQARSLSGKLLRRIADLNIENKNSPTEDHLTASIGVAEAIPVKGSDESEIVNKADRMLYKAKDRGRNRVEG